jgi:hypothetical protein
VKRAESSSELDGYREWTCGLTVPGIEEMVRHYHQTYPELTPESVERILCLPAGSIRPGLAKKAAERTEGQSDDGER